MGNNLNRQLQSGAEDAFNGTVNTVSDTLNGVEGHGFNYDDIARDWKNVGVAYHNAKAGYEAEQLYTAPKSQAEQLATLLNPNAANNKSLWAQTSGAQLHISYTPQAGTGDIVPPSQIQAIRDPNMKTLIARTRGSTRSALTAAGHTTDALVAPTLQQSAQSVASRTVNAAGGQGIATPGEQGGAMTGTMKTV